MTKSFFDTGEVAEMLDVQASTVRFWAESFEGLAPRKTAGGRRKFSLEDIERLKEVYHLVKEKGLTTQAARKQLRRGRTAGGARDLELMEHLQTVRAALLEIREELRSSEGEEWRVESEVTRSVILSEAKDLDQEDEIVESKNPQIIEQTLF